MGPTGAGKGTQAQFITDHIGGVLYDTGSRIRERLAKDPASLGGYDHSEGKLLDPERTRQMVLTDTAEICKSGKSIVFSGSPRSMLEAFGTKDDGLMNLLDEIYGRENITLFSLYITVEEAITRNTKRGEGRDDESPETIRTKYKVQYEDSVAPMLQEIRNRGYNVIDIDGMSSREEVFVQIRKYL